MNKNSIIISYNVLQQKRKLSKIIKALSNVYRFRKESEKHGCKDMVDAHIKGIFKPKLNELEMVRQVWPKGPNIWARVTVSQEELKKAIDILKYIRDQRANTPKKRASSQDVKAPDCKLGNAG